MTESMEGDISKQLQMKVLESKPYFFTYYDSWCRTSFKSSHSNTVAFKFSLLCSLQVRRVVT